MESKPTDTGGEFSGPLPLIILVAAEGPRTVAEASPPAADAYEQMANSEFATSVPTFRFHTARVGLPRSTIGCCIDQCDTRPMPTDSLLDVYLDDVRRVRALKAGTAETSYYPALGALLNGVGGQLRPRVFCLHHPSGDAGIPDFGLFEQAQFRRDETPTWVATVTPERGVVEVKGASHKIDVLVKSKQVREQYLPAYGLVLATNLWQFRLLDAGGTVVEIFDLAADEAGFWTLAAGSRPNTLRGRFNDFLQRCLLTRTPLARPSDVAFFLASYAREALARLADRAQLPALGGLRKGMEDALGIRFDGPDGERLFRSTLVQTLFYGVFSAWVVHARAGDQGFDWRASSWSLHVPVMSLLFQKVATPQALGPLGLVPLLDAAARALERVDRPAFFTAFRDAQAVQYFYEPFLEYFDPELRRQLGVWYTPPEIVRYQVERVDRVLRDELDIADGLADPSVWVLDPCCGTGSYVVAVLDRIRRTLDGKGMGDLAAEALKQAAITRVVGFEIMTAPFVIAHWQVGELLKDTPLQDGERAAIYLTNALTGWAESEAGPAIPGYEALVEERSAATAIKRERPILVVLGNPPYNAYAGLSPNDEGDLVEAYKKGLRAVWGVKKFNLDELYVRFFRIAERRVAEGTGRGIVSYISNSSWLSLPSFTVMRQSLLASFDRIWVENLHGDRTITEYGPDGRSSETIFAIDGFSPGIRQGVATALLVRTGQQKEPIYRYRNDLDASDAAQRRSNLVASLDGGGFDARYEVLAPTASNRFVLRPVSVQSAGYATWPALDTLAKTPPLPGLLEKRGGGLVSMDKAALVAKMRAYLDPGRSFEQARAENPALGMDRAGYVARKARPDLLSEGFEPGNVRRFCVSAFDMRWAYTTATPTVWNRVRPPLLHTVPDAVGFLALRPQQIADPEGFPAYWTSSLADDRVLHKHGFLVPVVENLSGAPRPNLSETAIAYLAELGIDPSPASAAMLWHHALATLYSPAYLAENAGGLRQGWPRVPLPASLAVLRSSAALGCQLAVLLNPDAPVPGITTGTLRPELACIGVPTTHPGSEKDWELCGWGNRTDKGVTMPLRGRVLPRAYSGAEAAISEYAPLLGALMVDVGMNDASSWRGIPEQVWECRIGGYQVLKKWLSYRDHSIIARPLSAEEVGHVQQVARRIASVLLLGPALDASYQDCVQAHP